MASSPLKLTTILFLTISLLLSLHSQIAFSDDIEDDEEYVLDIPSSGFRPRSGFLMSAIKEGAHCNPKTKNICNGVSANNGKCLLYCCNTQCRDILGDRNNCGRCGHKCKYGELCCSGTCTNVSDNVKHCGKCDKKCSPGVKCEYGTCGYA